MAQIQDRKSNFYSHKQSVREESLAPQYLESAGDVLVKALAKKQLQTRTTLQEQLEVTQNFQKGFELTPERRQGIVPLDDLKNQTSQEKKDEKLSNESNEKQNSQISVLSRHELELSSCEKPNSAISKLYKFAIKNATRKPKDERLESRLPDHPLNHLKEIEQEYFGHLKSKKNRVTDEESIQKKESKKPLRKKTKPRKRRKKSEPNLSTSSPLPKPEPEPHVCANANANNERESVGVSPGRPSLWDVKDMRKWCEPKKEYSCKNRSFYAIKDGKIVKLEESHKDVT